MVRRLVAVPALLLALAGCSATDSADLDRLLPAAAVADDPCDVVTDAAVAAILRVPNATGSPVADSEFAGGDIVQVCEYGDPDDPTAPRLTIKTTASDDYDLAVELLGSSADSVETIEIAGAEQASRLAKRKDRVEQYSVIVLARGRVHIMIADADSAVVAARIATEAAALLAAD